MQRLGSLEAVVMQRLWDAPGPMTVREVMTELQAERSIAYTTAMTVLDHLTKKGMVVRTKQGRAFSYSPTRSREDRVAELMGQALAESANRDVALMRFVENMSTDEAAQLRKLLAETEAPGRPDRSAP
ncbi:BlaI/MecI/CopY family transcriptional regulator [Nocardioides aurantiacus]|uniref:Putative transcriptional regulator n=1 Tax=Nocardioides aurantiacus TaxID=86796 RepID=A0A3N2CWN9_9ACTN|nr:BlaI/MecI/CopY family transcriptional regulator [Nocardioides aurantiacus]ROR91828.1 putative transcriptional regulator [Nocardioides aurantiacus]